MIGEMTITGIDDVVRALDELKESTQRRLTRAAARKAMRPVVPDARRGVPRDTGTLRQSIGIKAPRRSKKGDIVVSVGPRRGFAYEVKGEKRDPFQYGIPVEYGHVTRGGGFVPPAGFLRAAFHRHRNAIVDRFAGALGEEIEKHLARIAKKAAA